jgi:hypothetical protein
MSLTSHLIDPGSPIGQFLRAQFKNTQAVIGEANSKLKNVESILPSSRQSYPYGMVGMAMDYRLRYYFADTPVNDLVAYKGAMRFVSQVAPFYVELVEGIFDGLARVVGEIRPVDRLLDIDAESLLSRHCFALALFEEVYRSGRVPDLMPDLLTIPTIENCISELLAVADDAWIDEMCRMSRLFYERCQHLLTKPFVLNPTFPGSADVGNADADLVVDGCLLDVKASINARLDPQWLRQLAGFALLDYGDALSLRSVGIYMARQGVLLTWPLGHLTVSFKCLPEIVVQRLPRYAHSFVKI